MSHELTAVSPDEEPDIGHYKLLNTIGQGSFAKVSLNWHILMGSEVAVKVIQQQGYCRHSEFHCLRQLVFTVEYCHQRGTVHRDPNPENVLLDSERNSKLIDFGLSKEFISYQLSTFCGTPVMPPQSSSRAKAMTVQK
ncbi:hypothetical protein mRhiFer1_008129 [Rhinolophus ferrumequinum]|uniref:non-specific serine/threonine protein kinase n=1 Tax=Rhinolophus ferrumequinum TaxID=59479 RepID=A0A7J7W807_RHIFE|nr:hypothetical protein mRhiFer1_008128 [Rhinolophus ferrumequinum]KAF6333359.1 hypothetical protein mRhiFer1_008129 [Rhinolophus ferrumequinum]